MPFALSEWRVIEKDIVCIDKFLTLPLLFEFSLVVDKPTFNEPKKTKDSSKFLNRAPKPRHTVDVVVVVACQESQAFREVPDLREQQDLQERPDLKEPRDLKVTLVKKETKALEARLGKMGVRDLKDHLVLKAQRVTRANKGFKAPKAPAAFQGQSDVTGSSACSTASVIQRTLV